VGVRWPVSAAENRADLNNTSPVVSTLRVCLPACMIKNNSKSERSFLFETYFDKMY